MPKTRTAIQKISLLLALKEFNFGAYVPKVKSLSAKNKQILIIDFLRFYLRLLSFGIQLRKRSLFWNKKLRYVDDFETSGKSTWGTEGRWPFERAHFTFGPGSDLMSLYKKHFPYFQGQFVQLWKYDCPVSLFFALVCITKDYVYEYTYKYTFFSLWYICRRSRGV